MPVRRRHLRSCLALAASYCLVLLVCVGSYWLSAALYYAALRRPAWSEITVPVKPEVASDLCQQLAIAPSDRRCQPGAVVWAPDFFPK